MTFEEYKRWLHLVLQAVREAATPETALYAASAEYVLVKAIIKAEGVEL